MANNLNADLTGRVVIQQAKTLKPQYRNLEWRRFLVNSTAAGFGASPHANGGKVFGTYLQDGEDTFIRGEWVERFATDEELTAWEDEIHLRRDEEQKRHEQARQFFS